MPELTPSVPSSPSSRPAIPAAVLFGMVTELHVGDEVVTLFLDITHKPAQAPSSSSRTRRSGQPLTPGVTTRGNRGTTFISGGMKEGDRLKVVSLLREYIPDLAAPAAIENLTIDKLRLQIRPDYGSYRFECSISNVLTWELDSGPVFAIRQIDLFLETIKQEVPASNNGGQSPRPGQSQSTALALSQQNRFAFAGYFELFKGTFRVIVEHRFSQLSLSQVNAARSTRSLTNRPNSTLSSTTLARPQSMWSFWTFTAEARNIDLKEMLLAFDLEANLQQAGLEVLKIDKLEFVYTEARENRPNAARIEKEYRFAGEFLWKFAVAGENLEVQASVEFAKQSLTTGTASQSNLVGQVSGLLTASIPLFESMRVGVSYTFTKQQDSTLGVNSSQSQNRVEFLLFLGRFYLIGQFESTSVTRGTPGGPPPGGGNAGSRILTFTAGLLDPDQEQTIEAAVNSSNQPVKFGEILATVISLFDPNFTDFQLDPPWDKLGDFEIRLGRFQFEIDLTRKTFSVRNTQTIDLGLFKISNLGLTYAGATPASSGVSLTLDLLIPGQPAQRSSWDPINENPPAVPGTAPPIFDLQFLAIGQRVSFAPEVVAQARTITQVMNVMRQSLIPLPPVQRRQNPITALQAALPPAPVSIDPTRPVTLPPGSEPIIFNAKSGILIGAQFSVMGFLDMSFIFNDPLIYGVRIGLSGPQAQIFAGLIFEILYRRISDTIGVYHVELMLPDAMRQLQFGAVSVTLPGIVVDVYTNGDFGIDFGFPWQGNFERSFAIEALVFVGSGGFYFYKLSAETATSVPKITNGKFDPVLEFGLGLRVGVGRTFNKGPLRAEISITIHGILQGVIAWFKPSDPALSTEVYYKVQGGVAIVGRLYGVVDFSVITVEVEVIIRVAVLFVVECYQPILVALEAEVSVRASIKIVFVRVHFSFSLKVRQEFILGSASPTPWRLAPAMSQGGAMPALAPSQQPRVAMPLERGRVAVPRVAEWTPAPTTRLEAIATPPLAPTPISADVLRSLVALVPEGVRSLSWVPRTIAPKQWARQSDEIATASEAGPWVVNLYLQVALTRAINEANTRSLYGVALLFIENFIPEDKDKPLEIETASHKVDSDFDVLVKALLVWAIQIYGPNQANLTPDNVEVSLDSLEDLYESVIQHFESPAALGQFLPELTTFLSSNFIFEITDRPVDDKQDLSGSLFPMLPLLTMNVGGAVITFNANTDKKDPADLNEIRQYTRFLLGNSGNAAASSNRGDGVLNTGDDRFSIAELIFADYFVLLMRLGIQSAIDRVEAHIVAPITRLNYTITLQDLLDELNETPSFNHIAGTASRYLLHGLRLPTAIAPTPEARAALPTQALYAATRQQFPVPDLARINSLILNKPSGVTWIRFTDYSVSVIGGTQTIQIQPNAAQLHYTYGRPSATPEDLQKTLKHLQDASLDLVTQQVRRPALIPFYNEATPRYSIRNQSLWLQAGTVVERRSLLELPTDLQAALQNWPSGLDLTLKVNETPQAGQRVNGKDDPPLDGQWLTKVRLTIRRIRQADTGETLPATYLMVGTDTPGKALIDAILESGAEPTLRLLYATSSGDNPASLPNGATAETTLHSDLDLTALLLKTNLALSKASAPCVANPFTDGARPFLQMVLESTALEDGGFYLHYQTRDEDNKAKGLPEAIFTSGIEGSLVLLIQVPEERVYPFHNCIAVALDANAPTEEVDYYLESPQRVKVQNIPAGNLGFRLEREAIPLNTENDVGDDELANLYQLLSYQVQDGGSDRFLPSPQGLPLGPVADDPNTDLDDDRWIYERVIPVANLARLVDQASSSTFPTPDHDPYRGIAADGSVEIAFHWQDLYGNRLSADPSLTDAFVVRYFDEIVGINQWPSVSESYRFKTGAEADTVALELHLVLDQMKYLPDAGADAAETREKIASDRTTFEKIAYQLRQPDVSFAVQTSLLWTLHTLQAEDTLAALASAYGVPVETLAAPNQTIIDLFPEQLSLRLPLPLTLTQPDLTLRTIITIVAGLEALVNHPGSPDTLAAHLKGVSALPIPTGSPTGGDWSRTFQRVVQTISTIPHLLRAGKSITLPGATVPYRLQFGDTLADLIQDGITVEAMAIALLDDPLWATQVSWPLHLAYSWQRGERLDTLLQKVRLVMQHATGLGEDQWRVSVEEQTLEAIAQHNATLRLNPQGRSAVPPQNATTSPGPAPFYIPYRVSPSVQDAPTWPAFFMEFVDRAYAYLDALEQGKPVFHTVDVDESLQDVSDLYHVAVGNLAQANRLGTNLWPVNQEISLAVEWRVNPAHHLRDLATWLCQVEAALAAYATARDVAQITEPLPAPNAAQVTAKVDQLWNQWADVANVLTVYEEPAEGRPVKGLVGNYKVTTADTLATVSQETGLPRAALAEVEDLLAADLRLSLTVKYRWQAGDTLEGVQQKVKTLMENPYVPLEAPQLTAAAIAQDNPSIPLTQSMSLEIPQRIHLERGTPIRKADFKGSLAEVVAAFNAPASGNGAANPYHKEITAVDVAIANQHVHDLIRPHVTLELGELAAIKALLLPRDTADLQNLWLSLDEGTRTTLQPTMTPVLAFLHAPQTRSQETFSSLKARLEQVAQAMTLLLEVGRRWLQQYDRELDATATVERLVTLGLPLRAQLERVQTVWFPLDNTLAAPVAQQLSEPPPLELDALRNQFKGFVRLLQQVLEAIAARLGTRFTFTQVVGAIAQTPGLLNPTQPLIKPPHQTRYTLPLPLKAEKQLRYPRELITPVAVQVEIRRHPDLIHPTVKAIPAVQAMAATFTPRLAPEGDPSLSLEGFATDFQAAFPGLHLATSGDRPSSASVTESVQHSTQSLWAVHLGATGLRYDIKEAMPFFFTAAPLANTLMAGSVSIPTYNQGRLHKTLEGQRFDAIDLNGLARQFLAALEAFLRPESVMTALTEMQLDAQVKNLLKHKENLAIAISEQVTNILSLTPVGEEESTRFKRLQAAADALLRELKVNLAEAYDIETIIQYNVDVAIADDQPWRRQVPQPVVPRLAGKPVVAEVTAGAGTIPAPDFTLSPAKIPLDPRSSEPAHLTFFFNTKTPERFEEGFELALMYEATELEYNIDDQHQVSTWLRFVLPIHEHDSHDDYQMTAEVLTALRHANLPNRLTTALAPLQGQQWVVQEDFLAALEKQLGKDDLNAYQGVILTHANTSIPNYLGHVRIPVPLRTFPLSPSLILHQANPDRDSVLNLAQVREWQYELVYEHLGIAQDAIETRIAYNVSEAEAAAQLTRATVEDSEADTLFDALVQFSVVYPGLLPKLQRLSSGSLQDDEKAAITEAVQFFEALVAEVAKQWPLWQEIVQIHQPRSADYGIAEKQAMDSLERTITIRPRPQLTARSLSDGSHKQLIAIDRSEPQAIPSEQFPQIQLPEFKDTGSTAPSGAIKEQVYTFQPLEDTTLVQKFGESDIPDRKLILPSLDIIQQQNAWGSIWLTRNQELVPGMITNPAFVFQTPEVRFSDRLSPLLSNTRRWNVATVQSPDHIPLLRPLRAHIRHLFQTLLPERSDRPYDIRIACHYAFALVLGDPGLEDDLIASLPVFLSPRFPIPALSGATPGQTLSAYTDQFQVNIAQEIANWHTQKKPLQTKGRYVFSISIFAAQVDDANDIATTNNPNLPLLKVEHLSLALTDIIGFFIAASAEEGATSTISLSPTPDEYARITGITGYQGLQNIASLNTSTQEPVLRTLAAHLENLLAYTASQPHWATILGSNSSQSYRLHLIIQYVFQAEPNAIEGVMAQYHSLSQPLGDFDVATLRDGILTHHSTASVQGRSGYYVFTLSLVSRTAAIAPPEPLVTAHYFLASSRVTEFLE